MIPLKNVLSSSIGKKLITTLTGLLLVGFLVTHLAANLMLYLPDGRSFNIYARSLEEWGWLLYTAEAGLAVLFVLHIVNSILLKRNHLNARGQRYKMVRSKGGDTPSNISSRTMAVSGIVLMFFLIAHIVHFKFGPNVAEGYVYDLEGKSIRDLHRLVMESFQNPVTVLLYVGAMIFLASHLRHGLWSAVHSLGLTRPRNRAAIYLAGSIIGTLLAAGFLFIPIYVYVFGGTHS